MLSKLRNYFQNKKAIKDFEKYWQDLLNRADANDRGAMFEIAMLYESGVGAAKDIDKAIEYYSKAAELGLVDAQRIMAAWFEKGVYLEQNLVKALMWYRKCAESNNFDDAMKFACLCARPDIDYEIAKDYLPKAIEILKNGVEIGDLNAICYYGNLMVRGLTKDGNPEKGYQLLKQAAFKGNSESQIFIGDACAAGIGTKRDLKEALRWYEVAQKNSHPIAAERIERLK